MPRKNKIDPEPKQPSAREEEIASLRAIGREGRDAEQNARLALLAAEERRDRFTRLLPRRIARLKSSVKGVMNMASAGGYEYTPDEAQQIVAAVASYAAEVKRAFGGAPKEKGLYDL